MRILREFSVVRNRGRILASRATQNGRNLWIHPSQLRTQGTNQVLRPDLSLLGAGLAAHNDLMQRTNISLWAQGVAALAP